ncbi:putative nuclease HARBI1 [Eriocheir sinensis]|uniref:putative nuclease HARBI1 n=1 Tax=Eriocheir sinensis TaxID=95602 RepID=UPI0021C615D4|nr:putative nuclease HARBI1 [Eriocheir sinensis]
MRPALPVGLKLGVTLRYLATGDDYTSLHYDFRVSVPSISRFVPKVLKAIIQVYKDEYLHCPRTPEAWKEVADGFSRRWNYHNCLGALDGKHVPIRRPPHAGSKFFNYKKFHSIILLALADSGLRFIYVDVGAEGGAGDAGTWNRCTLQQAIESGALSLPDDTCLPHDDTPCPTTSARRVVENAFGVMQRKFKVFGVTQGILPATVRDVVTTCCILHNMVVTPAIQPAEIDHEDEDHNIVPGSWREGETLMADLAPARGNNPSRRAKAVRDYLANYYTSEVGAVPWQERLVYPRGRPQDAE